MIQGSAAARRGRQPLASTAECAAGPDHRRRIARPAKPVVDPRGAGGRLEERAQAADSRAPGGVELNFIEGRKTGPLLSGAHRGRSHDRWRARRRATNPPGHLARASRTGYCHASRYNRTLARGCTAQWSSTRCSGAPRARYAVSVTALIRARDRRFAVVPRRARPRRLQRGHAVPVAPRRSGRVRGGIVSVISSASGISPSGRKKCSGRVARSGRRLSSAVRPLMPGQ